MADHDRARICEQCGKAVAWGPWHFAGGSDRGIEVRDGRCGCGGKGYLQTRQPQIQDGDEIERMRAEWRAADIAYEEAIRQGRAPIEVEALLHKKRRLEAAYFEKVLQQST